MTQQPPLPHGLPHMLGMPLQPGMPPRPLHFPGGFHQPQSALQPPLPAPRTRDELVQDFKDLLLEAKVSCALKTPPICQTTWMSLMDLCT